MAEEHKEELMTINHYPDALFSGESHFKKEVFFMYLQREGLSIIPYNQPSNLDSDKEKFYPYLDILGAFLNSTKSPSFTLLTYSCRPRSTLRTFEVIFNQKRIFICDNAQEWSFKLQSMSFLGSLSNSNSSFYKRKILVFINPHSGKGRAQRNWEAVQEMFLATDAEVISNLYLVTTHQNHAAEVVSTMELKYDAIIVISGDGLIHEVLNGIARRPDSELARHIPVSTISGGSANAMSKYLCEKAGLDYSIYSNAFLAIKGSSIPMDATQISRESGPDIYSFMNVVWGIVADIDIESEMCRFCGACRFDMYGALRSIKLRRYRGKVVICEAEEEKVVEDDIISVLSMSIPYLTADMRSASRADLNDGCNDIYLVLGNSGRSGTISSLCSLGDGDSYLNNRNVQYFKTSKWRLEPAENRGVYSIDGEAYPVEPITITVLKSFFSTLSLTNESRRNPS